METTTETTVVEGDYENPWLYQGTAFTSNDIGDKFGYVYLIVNKRTGKKYIGRKYFTQCRKPRGGKRRVSSESDWKKYYGSSEETRQLFLNNVLTESLEDGTPAFYNSNILGRYYRKDYFEGQFT